MKKAEPELGHMMFGQPWQPYQCPYYVTALLNKLDDDLETLFWNITQRSDIYDSPFGNTGSGYDFGVFQVEAYNWNDEEDQYWNFKCGEIEISWYKYLGRDMTINGDYPTDRIIEMFTKCADTIRERQPDLMKEIGIEERKKVAGINLTKLTKADIYRPVVYVSSGKDKVERGWISSWNDKYIFVRYHQGDTSAATDPRDLGFIDNYEKTQKQKQKNKRIMGT